MSTTTIRHPAHYHVTVRRTGREVSVESMGRGVHRKCDSVANAKACERDTIRSWRAAAAAWSGR